MADINDRIRTVVGDLVIKLQMAEVEIERLRAKIKELEAKDAPHQ